MFTLGNNAYRPRRGFTLIEMLIVIGILSILLGLLYGSLERARKFSRYTIAYNEVKQIQAAFEQYYAHYHAWPTNNTSGIDLFPSADGQDFGFVITREIAEALQGVDQGNNILEHINPDGLPFIEFPRLEPRPNNQAAPCNPFKPVSATDETRRFVVLFDTNGDRQIYVPENTQLELAPQSFSTNIIANVAVWTVIPGFREKDSSGNPQAVTDIRIGSWEPFNLPRPQQ